MTSLVCGILKEIIQMNLLTKQKETQDLENELMVMGGRDGWRVGDGRVHTARLGRATNRDLLCRAGSSAQCHVAAWRGGRFGGGWMHVYVWLSPCAVPLKPSQHCLLISYPCSSVTQLCLTPWDPMNCSTPGPSVLHYLLELAQTHVC